MKDLTIVIVILISSILAYGQSEKAEGGPLLIGDTAPAFVATSTNGKVTFPDDYFARWKIIFSHPADFTPVCASEIMELASMQDEFDKLNTSILVVSTDGLNSHIEWLSSLETLTYKDVKIPKIKFPLIADEGLNISKQYGMLHPNSSSTKDIRGVFIINPENKIQAMFFYPLTVGRNLDEIKRTLIALQTHEKHNVLTPANWKPGDYVLIPSPGSMREAEKLKSKNDPDLHEVDWYMWLKKL